MLMVEREPNHKETLTNSKCKCVKNDESQSPDQIQCQPITTAQWPPTTKEKGSATLSTFSSFWVSMIECQVQNEVKIVERDQKTK